MAKRWHVLHRNKPPGFRTLKKGKRVYRACQTCGEKILILACVLEPGEPEHKASFYCGQHAVDAGYCAGCGLFQMGIDRFDFGPGRGLCENCYAEVQANEYHEEDELDLSLDLDSEDYPPEAFAEWAEA